MDHRWLILVVLGLAAAFMPWQIVYEIFILGEEGGLKKATAFVGGITMFRLLLILVMGLLFAGISAWVTQAIVQVAAFMQDLVVVIGREARSGRRVFMDVLLVLSGLLLVIESYLYYRRAKAKTGIEEVSEEEKKVRSIGSTFVLGLAWTAISLNQWLFTLTAVNQILFIADSLVGGLLLAALYLVLASLLILAPIAVFLIRPESAVERLRHLNSFINSTFFYLIVVLMFAGSMYLIWIGSKGFYKFADEILVLY